MQACMATLMSDPQAAFGAVIHDRVAPGGGIFAGYVDYLRAGHAASGKPAFLVSNRQGTGVDSAVISVTREGFPVIDGLRSFLTGAKRMLDYRDHLRRARDERTGRARGRARALARGVSPTGACSTSSRRARCSPISDCP
jgi:hypothetical protein